MASEVHSAVPVGRNQGGSYTRDHAIGGVGGPGVFRATEVAIGLLAGSALVWLVVMAAVSWPCEDSP